MTLYDFAECLSLKIKMTRYPQQGGRWTCSFDGVDVCEGESMLRGAYGNGKTPEIAINDYVRQISGQRVKINNERYATVPELNI